MEKRLKFIECVKKKSVLSDFFDSGEHAYVDLTRQWKRVSLKDPFLENIVFNLFPNDLSSDFELPDYWNKARAYFPEFSDLYPLSYILLCLCLCIHIKHLGSCYQLEFLCFPLTSGYIKISFKNSFTRRYSSTSTRNSGQS